MVVLRGKVKINGRAVVSAKHSQVVVRHAPTGEFRVYRPKDLESVVKLTTDQLSRMHRTPIGDGGLQKFDSPENVAPPPPPGKRMGPIRLTFEVVGGIAETIELIITLAMVVGVVFGGFAIGVLVIVELIRGQ